MSEEARAKIKRIVPALVLALCVAALVFTMAGRVSAPASVMPGPEPTEIPENTPQPVATLSPEELAKDAEKIVLAELMSKNRATLRDGDGDFSDWIELENISDTSVDLGGWSLSDREDGEGWQFPAVTLEPGERQIVFVSGKNRAGELHTDFSLSAGENVYLRNKNGYLAATVLCRDTAADVSLCRTDSGDYTESLYPTPGYANTSQGYDAWQAAQSAAGPLVINEVVVANLKGYKENLLGYCDWVEIKNISNETVEMVEYYLSDDRKDYHLWQFPEGLRLAPGELLLVCCDGSDTAAGQKTVRANFDLNSEGEELFLTNAAWELIDFVSLRDIPFECSYGRTAGENGWFYFSSPSPGRENGEGYRRVSATPAALTADGVFDGVETVEVELSGSGTVYYTTDGTVPTTRSAVYEGPLSVSKTCIVRAIAVEEGAMPSRTRTLSYILNQNHSLPVLSLVSDNRGAFKNIYNNKIKHQEVQGSLALYEEAGGFVLPCGIRMYGETSLVLPKKNMSIHFRGAYGQGTLEYDVYGGGVTEFGSFVLRSGQDFYDTIVRNELALNLGLQLSDRVMSLRSKYCVLYIDGEYWGIYALMEKSNEQHYANLAGVSKDSVTVLEAPVAGDTALYEQVYRYALYNDLSVPENYEHLCSVLDIDSLIDWLVLEGYTANTDLTYGNLRWCQSTENDGKWRLMFYDLDAAFRRRTDNFDNMFSSYWLSERQLSHCLVAPLLKNEEFVDRFLTRAGEALNGALSNENAAAELDRLAALVEPEVARDWARFDKSYNSWARYVADLRAYFVENDWRQHNIDALSRLFRLSEEEKAKYFG